MSFTHADTGIAQATSSVASQAVTLSAAVSIGDVICVVWGSPAPNSDTVSDNSPGGSNTWVTPHTGANFTKFAYTIATKSAPSGITITTTGGGSGTRFLVADRFSVSGGTAVFGSSTAGVSLTGTSGNLGSLSGVPAGELLWGGAHSDTANITWTAGASNSVSAAIGSQVGNAGGDGFSEYILSGAGGTESLTWTTNAGLSAGGGGWEAYFTVTPAAASRSQAVLARLPQQPLLRGRSASSAGAPVRNPVAGPAFIQKTWPVQAADPLPRRGRAASNPGAPVRNPVQGPAFRQAPRPARSPVPQVFSKGRVSGNPGAPVQNPSQGPVFQQAVRAVRAVIPQVFSKGRAASNPGAPVRNPSAGPPFIQAPRPARAPVPQVFSKGRGSGNPGAPVRNPAPGPVFRQAVQALHAVRVLPRRGRATSGPGGPVQNPVVLSGPVFHAIPFPARARIQPPPRGRAASNPGGPVQNRAANRILVLAGQPHTQWAPGLPLTRWTPGQPES